jgi:TRAP transporter TAXI family solute receptor
MQGKKIIFTKLGILVLVSALVALLVLSSCAPQTSSVTTSQTKGLPKQVAINCVPSGTQYAEAAALGNVVEKYSGMAGFVEPTKSFSAAVPLFLTNDLDLIFVGIGDIADANLNQGAFVGAGAIDEFRTVALGTGTWGAFFTSPKTGIKNLSEMAGKKVMWNSPTGGSFNNVAQLILQYYKIQDKIVDIPSPDPVARANALQLGQIDAYYCSFRADAMQVLSDSVGMVILDTPADCAAYVHQNYPSASAGVVNKGYNGGLVSRDCQAVGVATGIFCRTNLSDDVVTAVLKAAYDHIAEFQAGYPDLTQMTINTAVSLQSTVPYHPAAIQYFKSKGVWTADADTMQQQTLAQITAAKASKK